MRRSLILSLGLFAVSSHAAAAETVIDDFESGTSAWTFANGAEFPGATGSLSSGAGHGSAKGAALAYDFTGGGHYVAATRALGTPLTAAAIGFWAQAPAGIHAKLRVTDSSNQTFQYDVNRPLGAFDAAAWYRQVIDLNASSSHYGGANDGVVRQPIESVTLMAADPVEAGATGTVEFDDVVAVDAIAPRIGASPATLVGPPPQSASLGERVGVNIHFTKDDRALDLASQAGFTFVRMDLGWSGVERMKGVYDFTALDGLVASLASRNLKLLLILDYFNPLYPAADSPDYGTATVPAFAAVAKSAATHFSEKNVVFEIWNEPNGDGFWPPKADPTQYAALCKAGIAAVHQGNPNAAVTTAGIAGFDYPFFRAYLAAGGGEGADAIGVHPYRQGGGESVIEDLLLLKKIVGSTFATAPPVWATEWGYSSTWYGGGQDAAPLHEQAVFAARELLSAWALGFPLVTYYDIRDDGTDPTNAEHNFGLLQNDYTDKPAMVAVRTLTKAASGQSFVGFVPLEPSSLHAMYTTHDGFNIVFLWSDATGSETAVAVPAGTTAVDAFGAPLALATSGGGLSVVVREADGPVYLTLPRSVLVPDGGATLPDGGGVGTGGASTSENGGSGNAASGGASSGSGASSSAGGAPNGPGGPTLVASVDAGAGGRTPRASEKDSPGCGCTFARTANASPLELGAWLLGVASLRRRKRRALGR